MDNIDAISRGKEKWAQEKGGHEADLVEVDLDTNVEALYTPADVKDIDYMRDIGFPGEYPFTRGVYPLMYRKRIWDMRQYSGLETCEDTNKRCRALLDAGQQSLSLACDLPTQLGYDSDDQSVEEEMLKVGCHIDTLADIETMFDGIPMDKVPCSFNLTSQAPVLLAMFIAAAEKKGVPQSKLSGTMANDILIEYLSRGAWVYPMEPSMRLMADVVEYVCRNMPRFYPLNIRAVLLGIGGRVISDYVAYGFSIAYSYIEEILKRGLSIDDFASKISFLFCAGSHFFEYAALFRAARKHWAKATKERFGAKNDDSMKLKFTACPVTMEYTSAEPVLNLVREAYAIQGAALGGAQTIFAAGMDENYAIPTERNALLALRTIQILAHETDVAHTVDPLGGSYYVEALTRHLETRISEQIDEVDKLGGAVKAIEAGYIQRKLSEGYYLWQKDIEDGTRPKIGLNLYPSKTKDFEFYKVDPEALTRQRERLRRVKAGRDEAAVNQTLTRVQEAAGGAENIIPPLIEAVKTYATVGEITNTLKRVFGEYRESAAVF